MKSKLKAETNAIILSDGRTMKDFNCTLTLNKYVVMIYDCIELLFSFLLCFFLVIQRRSFKIQRFNRSKKNVDVYLHVLAAMITICCDHRLISIKLVKAVVRVSWIASDYRDFIARVVWFLYHKILFVLIKSYINLYNDINWFNWC